MLKAIDKARLYVCWRLALLGKAIFNDGLHVWKASLVISVLEFSVAFIALILVGLVFEVKIIPEDPTVFAIFIAVTVTVFNYFSLIHRWKIYEEEFNKYTKKQHTIYGFLIITIIIGIVLLLIQTVNLLARSQT